MRPLTALRMPALGEEFRRAREARGQTISDVAERLHIRSVYLTAIEDEDWAAIGAPVYIRGFMRTYARYLGLDPEAAVARLADSAPIPAGRSSSSPAPIPAGDERSDRRRSPSAAALLAVIVAIALVSFVAYQYSQYRNQGTVTAPVAVASPGASGSPAAAAGDAAGPSAAEPTPVVALAPSPLSTRPRLGIALTETSWLRVVVDGKVAMEGTYPPGTAKTFTGKIATVRIGNAGGVRIAIDGRPVGKLGADGDVVERRFALAGE
jgi:cytoskeleton protein RodZ